MTPHSKDIKPTSKASVDATEVKQKTDLKNNQPDALNLFDQLRNKKQTPVERFRSLAKRNLQLARLNRHGLTMQESFLMERILINVRGVGCHLKSTYLDEKLTQWNKEGAKGNFSNYVEKNIAQSEDEFKKARENIVPYFTKRECDQYLVSCFEKNIPVVSNEKITPGEYIFVVDLNHNLYICPNTQTGGINIHHSSFTQSLNLTSAGMLTVNETGELHFSNFSGHYCPPEENFITFIKYLAESKIDPDKASVTIINFDDPLWFLKPNRSPAQKLLQEYSDKKTSSKDEVYNSKKIFVLQPFDQKIFDRLDKSKQREYLLQNLRMQLGSFGNKFYDPHFKHQNYIYLNCFIKRFNEGGRGINMIFYVPKGIDKNTIEKILDSLFRIKPSKYIFSGNLVEEFNDELVERLNAGDPVHVIAERPDLKSTPKGR